MRDLLIGVVGGLVIVFAAMLAVSFWMNTMERGASSNRAGGVACRDTGMSRRP